MNNKKSIIEGLLFAMGAPVEISDIAAVLEEPVEIAESYVRELADEYELGLRGIRIIKLENAYQMCTDKSVYESLIKYVTVPKRYELTDIMLETLAIIAFKQPVTRVEIENIRGVSSDHAINRLIEYGLVEEAGRKRAPGRPHTFRTTDEFLRRFGLESADDLPSVDSETMEYIRQAVAKETGYYDEEGMQLELDLEDPTKEEIRKESDEEAAGIAPASDGESINIEI
ncbi:MAG: SMC-Scp complex subunit ScpB [Lachnospiraceae bacterium]|nr:SMC-Scp complex subunit ScpB [Lachnospiraceae bacterium]